MAGEGAQIKVTPNISLCQYGLVIGTFFSSSNSSIKVCDNGLVKSSLVESRMFLRLTLAALILT